MISLINRVIIITTKYVKFRYVRGDSWCKQRREYKTIHYKKSMSSFIKDGLIFQ